MEEACNVSQPYFAISPNKQGYVNIYNSDLVMIVEIEFEVHKRDEDFYNLTFLYGSILCQEQTIRLQDWCLFFRKAKDIK